MTTPLITPSKIRKHYILKDSLNNCDGAILGFLTFSPEIESQLHHFKNKIVSIHDDRRQFFGELNGKRYIAIDRVFGGCVIASIIEELVALYKVKKIVGIGLSGTLEKKFRLGDYVLATSAVNSVGVGKEYNPKKKLFTVDKIMASRYKVLTKQFNLNFNTACVWTTEAIYQEYPEKLVDWKIKGGEIVNMETSHFYSVCNKLNIPSLYSCVISDYLFMPEWDYKLFSAENQTLQLFNLLREILISNVKGPK